MKKLPTDLTINQHVRPLETEPYANGFYILKIEQIV